MSTKLVRIPLAWPIGTRSGFSTSKDPFVLNGFIEPYGDERWVQKRPGTDTYITLGTGGTSQGITFFNDLFFGVVDDVLYRQTGTFFVGTDGTSWTSTATINPDSPQWTGTQGMGSCVFKNRMFLIGGIGASTGIWSTVDGVNWAVNAGGQPWGFRSRPGVVVFNDTIFVLGGFNTTLFSAFNDVWSSTNGTSWTQIVADTGAITMWNPRAAACCVATPNGIYVYAGDNGSSIKYNDVWYSNDGKTWNQVNASAPWSARSGAACFWFQNKIWIVGGLDNGGVALNDAWSSPDGVNWTLTTAAAFGSGRYYPYYTVYRDKMWVLGGTDNGSMTLQDGFSSDDGVTWQTTNLFIGMTSRTDGACMVFQVPTSVSQYGYQTIYMVGGYSSGPSALKEVYYGNLGVSLPLSFNLNPDEFQQPYQFVTYINGQLLLLKNQSNAWVLQSGTLTPVTDVNYPPITVPGFVVLNAFAYVMTPNGEIHNCKLENPFIWPVLDFVTADYEDDFAVCLAKYLNYVVAFGQYTTQFFYDNGANQPEGSPLAPYINANLRVGCVNAESVANISNTLFWVAQTRQGTRYVAMFNGLTDQKVSNVFVDKIVAATSAGALVGIGAAVGGHFYYILKTGVFTALVYDITQQEWYEWDTFSYGFFVSNGNTGGNYLFSTSGGNLVNFSPLWTTDILNGNYEFLIQTAKTDFGNTAQKYFGRATLVGDTSNATPGLSWTDDDYQTFSTPRTVDMTLERPYITRLGPGRRRAWRAGQTDDEPGRYLAIEVEYSQGES